VVRAKSSRSFSIFSSHGQPIDAFSHAAPAKNETTGSRMSVVASVVVKADQPPADGASLRERRARQVCQSVAIISTLKPPRSSSRLGDRRDHAGRGVRSHGAARSACRHSRRP
jgi:hypothetical protein